MSFYDDCQHAVLNDLFCSSLFQRMGGHYSRMVVDIPNQVTGKLLIADFPPPPGVKEYTDELIDLLLCAYGRHHFASDNAKKTHKDELVHFFPS